jgi:uncharacterized protein (TIGR03435 family)
MPRTLLADRFRLRVHDERREVPAFAPVLKSHHETREMPICALTLARSDGRLAPGLRPSAVECAALAAARVRGGPPPVPPAPGQPMPCGMRIGPGMLTAGSSGIQQVANSLAQMVGRIIVDRTGLTQSFDFDLKWTPDQMPPRAARSRRSQGRLLAGADRHRAVTTLSTTERAMVVASSTCTGIGSASRRS